MTFDEFKILVKGMKAVYTSPNFLPDADSVKIWYRLLGDMPYELASIAIPVSYTHLTLFDMEIVVSCHELFVLCHG